MSSSIPKCKLCLNTLWNYQPPDEASEETVQFWKDLVRIADENIGKIRQYNEKINFKVLDEPKCSLSKNHFPEDPYGREMKDPHKVWNVFEKRAIDRAAYLVNIPESWEEWEELEGLKNDSDDLKELQEDLNDEVGWDKWLEEFLKNDEEMMKKEQELRNKNKGLAKSVRIVDVVMELTITEFNIMELSIMELSIMELNTMECNIMDPIILDLIILELTEGELRIY
ncbi:hypothetical protein MMC10_010828 [Thelotrema lepadinum]|nr:hypothetical protein [Thelotrema lepadinum]